MLPLSATLAELCQDYGIVEVVLGLGDRCEELAIACEVQGEASEQMNQNLPCAVILTAIPIEYTAVRAHLTDLQEEEHSEGTIYERGVFSYNDRAWQVGIVEIGAGNAEAAVETKRAVDYFKPSIVLFVGVAGGIKDVKLGDVVAATKVYGYESGKVVEETFQPRPNVSWVSYSLEQRARAEARKSDWLERIKEKNGQEKPHAFVGAIAAGDKLVASTNSDVYNLLRTNYGDALAVEMESHGFLKAIRANPEINALIIRGISDLIDGKSHADAAGSQDTAARHASAFAFEILAKLNVPQSEITINKSLDVVDTDTLLNQVEKYLSKPDNHISLKKLVLQEAKTLAEVMQSDLEACSWELSTQNQQQCQRCIEHLEAKSERFVRTIATIVSYDSHSQFIDLIINALKILVKEPFPLNTSVTYAGRFIRFYPLAIAIYAVFIVGVQEKREQLLQKISQMTWDRQSNLCPCPNLPMISTLIYLDHYSGSIFNAVLKTPSFVPVAERIKSVLLPWIKEFLLLDENVTFYQGEFVLGLANIQAEVPTDTSQEKNLQLKGLYLYYPEARHILTAFVQDSAQWLIKVYPALKELLKTFDATASRLGSPLNSMYGFAGGACAALKDERQY